MTIRLYGSSIGYGSHAQVTRGFEGTLADAGLLAGFVRLDEEPMPDEPAPPGAAAPIAIFTGPLGYVGKLVQHTAHQQRYAMVAVNSTWVPPNLLHLLKECCTGLLAPSSWNASVLRAASDLPVTVVPHGVSPDFLPVPDVREQLREAYQFSGAFRALHLSSSIGQRKGTHLLLDAWEWCLEQQWLPPSSQLDVVLDLQAHGRLVEWFAERGRGVPKGVAIRSRVNLPPKAMAQLYAAANVVVQPSRGEGFGMCGLESLACGVPICATACTGHEEWMRGLNQNAGVVVIPHGPDAPIDDGPDGAVAPAVLVDDVAVALGRAFTNWRALDAAVFAHADAVRKKWSWAAQVGPFVRALASGFG